ncbi:MAG: 16S rRNA (adenine(1518)-N(6)/adenine(1519)-N(6))-dimethyltransferase RsmA [Akkermansia sp.]
MKATQIRDILEEYEVRPSKALGQNFLTDENIAQWIVEQLDIQPEDCVVEVGPGAGSLTEHAVPLCRKMILIEFDSRLVEYQRERWRDFPHVEVHHADAAEWDPRRLFAEAPVKFLSNLPYSAGGAIIQNFLSRPSPVSRAVVMLQKEFIDRILATPDDDAYGLLSLRVQKNWIPQPLKTIPPEAFSPRPRIDSTVMSLMPRPLTEFPPYDARLMDELMRKAFSQRRKQLKNQLPSEIDWKAVAHAMGINETVRPEELNLAQWIALTNHYDTSPLKGIPQKDGELLDVVDSQNQVIGQKTRKEIHEGNLTHRAVHILVRNKHGAILLQKRSPWKDRHPGVWDSSAAGHVDAGESYMEAAKRELHEELGIDDIELHEVAHFEPNEQNGMEHVQLLVAGYSGKTRFPAAEIEAVQWFAPELITAWLARRPNDFASSFRQCWEFAMNPESRAN